jgi:hypothetical protein
MHALPVVKVLVHQVENVGDGLRRLVRIGFKLERPLLRFDDDDGWTCAWRGLALRKGDAAQGNHERND